MKARKWIIPAGLFTFVFILAMFLVPTATAGQTISGGTIEIKQGEIVPDDLYVFAETLLINGTIQGDLISFSTNVIIGPTGVVEGDLLAAGLSLEIQGVVKDDVRRAGAALVLGDAAQIGDDLLSAGFSLETKPGSQVGGALTFAGYQALLAGSVKEDLVFAGNSLNLQGTVGGDADVTVGARESNLPINPFSFIPNMPAVPTVPAGLTVGANASIGGSLDYQAPQEASIPAGAVAGETEYTQVVQPTRAPAPTRAPEAETEAPKEPEPVVERQLRSFANWGRSLLSHLMSLLIVGLLVAWLWPRLLSGGGETLKVRPWASLGVGILTGIVFWLVMPFLTLSLLFIVFLLGLFSLGGLVFPALLIMGLVLTGLTLAFLLSGSYFSKLIISQVVGQLILGAFKSPAANNRFLPWLIGLVIFIILWSIPYIGWIFNILAVVFGLGAFVLWLFGLLKSRGGPAAEPPAPVN
jgi:cytoskeletal protein CcmA (bactofilin family)